MIARLSRGRSFKALARYLEQGERQPGQPQPTTSNRVGFTETFNFDGNAPQGNVTIAARIMAAVWQARERLKRKAKVRKGGSKAKAPPVLHGMLSWPPGDQVTPDEMREAVREALAAIGLDLGKGYQTIIMQHTDTKAMHLHYVVNLVHPVTGRQADPFNDWNRLHRWARGYDKKRGVIACPAREARYAAHDKARASIAAKATAMFGEPGIATGEPVKQDRYGRRRGADRKPRDGKPRQTWQGSPSTSPEAEAAGERIKAQLDPAYHTMKTRHRAAQQQRQRDIMEGRASKADPAPMAQRHAQQARQEQAEKASYAATAKAAWAQHKAAFAHEAATRQPQARPAFQQQAGRDQPRQPPQKPAPRTQFRRAADDGTAHDPASIIEAITTQQSTFTRRDLARHIWTHTADADEFRALMAKVEAAPELVRLGHDARGVERFTARDIASIERQMKDDALTLHGRKGHGVTDWKRSHAVQALQQASAITLTDEQKAALRHITGQQDMAAIVGFAGSGKSTMLAAARLAWEAAGYRVRGAALSGIAADGLQQGASIDSGTIHSLLFALDKGSDHLTARDVLVIDEAGMIGSRLMARVLAHARAAGAKVVLVGDAEQLQAIDAGAAFRAIVDRIGAAKLTTIRRQREAWQQQASRDLATANTAAALDRYDQAGMLHGHATADEAKAALIDRWDEARQTNPNATQIILAYTRVDVRDLNEQARAVRKAAGELGPDHAIQTAQGARQFATGDRIYFLKNDRTLGVRNGSLATLESIEGDRLTVRMDDGKRVSFSAAAYSHIDHGYAATVHKSQGVTVDRAHVLATRHMDRHAAYVAMTRHRDRLDLHWTTADLPDRAALAAALGRARAKDTTLDYEDIPAYQSHGKAASAAPRFQANQ